MAKIGNYTVKGKSGKEYKFEVYPIDATWREVEAVYLVTKRREEDGKGFHTKIYVGETENLKERHSSHHKADCFAKHDANCLCVYVEKDEQVRLAIETDILAVGNWPCND